MSGTVQGIGNIAVNKKMYFLALNGVYILLGEIVKKEKPVKCRVPITSIGSIGRPGILDGEGRQDLPSQTFG